MTSPADDRARRLLDVALDLVTAIRDHGPNQVAATLATLPAGDQRDVTVLLAALVPEDRTPRQLLAWWLTRAAVVDLPPAGEPPWASRRGLREDLLDPLAA